MPTSRYVVQRVRPEEFRSPAAGAPRGARPGRGGVRGHLDLLDEWAPPARDRDLLDRDPGE
ncbi:hypothetical protein ACFXPH_30410, partial [Streptomyces goshikiensis]|uniref:hypothetical protein n=1 Tax=Streptomyces goshikiensis TaxID=1942 RepID=UPI003677E34A